MLFHIFALLNMYLISQIMPKKKIDMAQVKAAMLDLFNCLTQEEQTLLEESVTTRKLKRNERIFCEGQPTDHIYCLFSGKVKIYKNGVGGRNQTVRLIRPVQYFGYSSCFYNKEHITSATALETCLLASLPVSLLTQIMQRNSNLALFFIRKLSEALVQADERTVSLTQKHIRGRLAEALLFLKECYGLEEDGYTLSIYMSREDLANLSNMTTSNAIRTLSAFAAEKLIVVDGRKIKIIQEKELDRISKLG